MAHIDFNNPDYKLHDILQRLKDRESLFAAELAREQNPLRKLTLRGNLNSIREITAMVGYLITQ